MSCTHSNVKIVVAGGGYAGLACLMELRRRMPDAALHLYDPRAAHLKITHLHETLRFNRSQYEVAFADIAVRLGFEHHQEPVGFDDGELCGSDGPLDYDYAVITTGARPLDLPRADGCCDVTDFMRTSGQRLVDEFIADDTRARTATIVGGGATGVQFAFELAELLRTRRSGVALRVVDRDARPLAGQPDAVGDYVRRKMTGTAIDYLPETEYVSAGDNSIRVRDASGEHELASGLTLLFAGARPSPRTFEADRHGRVDGIRDCFAAGDCARYDSRGADAMTAQVAVRQGKHVARNIDRVSRGVEPLEYFFQELGFVVSLGPLDAAGWMLTRGQVVTGIPAFAVKSAVEAQYDLFVAGLDTYLV